jgi:hypothetical protein
MGVPLDVTCKAQKFAVGQLLLQKLCLPGLDHTYPFLLRTLERQALGALHIQTTVEFQAQAEADSTPSGETTYLIMILLLLCSGGRQRHLVAEKRARQGRERRRRESTTGGPQHRPHKTAPERNNRVSETATVYRDALQIFSRFDATFLPSPTLPLPVSAHPTVPWTAASVYTDNSAQMPMKPTGTTCLVFADSRAWLALLDGFSK